MTIKIKPLEWEYHPVGIMAAPSTGHAYIFDTRMKGHFRSIKGFNPQRDFDTLDEAKAAAQADYERRILAALEPAPVTVGEAAEELDDEGEIIRRLLSGETICYSQDGDDAWLSGGDKASLSERAILQLRKAGYLTRKNDDEERVSWDEASAALRALADAGEAGE